jgi:hypothetical protein
LRQAYDYWQDQPGIYLSINIEEPQRFTFTQELMLHFNGNTPTLMIDNLIGVSKFQPSSGLHFFTHFAKIEESLITNAHTHDRQIKSARIAFQETDQDKFPNTRF